MPEFWRGRVRLVGLLLAFVFAGLTGCAQDVGDIDRTQPDKIKKSMLQKSGEWYFQQTVIDTTAEGRSGVDIFGSRIPQRKQRPIFTALVSRKLKRVQWEIHEDVLYARSTVEPTKGLTEQVDGEEHQELGIVAAFPIKSHFDVQRQYNSSTGEPTNVIVENRSDRPWYDREYMRVDWSTNLVTSTSSVHAGLGLMSPKAAAKNSRALPQEEREVRPNRTRVSSDYIDAVTEYVFNPDVYSCTEQLGYDALWRCEGGTATVRNSFWRVDARKKQRAGRTGKLYKPLQYRDDVPLMKKGEDVPMESSSVWKNATLSTAECTDSVKENARSQLVRQPEEACSDASFDLFDRFGFFRTNVANWSEERHTYESGRKQYANRWNIWESMYDENGELLKAKDREPEPIVYHLNAAYPKNLMGAAERVEKQWDETFKEAVMLAGRYDSIKAVENKLIESGHREGKMFMIKKNGCHPSKITQWRSRQGDTQKSDRRKISKIFNDYVESKKGEALTNELWSLPNKERKRLCAELEWATEKRKEGARFRWQRLGDLRHSFFAWINDFNIGWLGYGPSSADPKSGEIISAAANFAGRLLEPYANSSADIVQFLNDEISPESIKEGDHVRKQMAEAETKKQGLVPEGVGTSNTRDVPNLEGSEREISIDHITSKIDPIDENRSKTAKNFGMSPDRILEEAHRMVRASAEADAVDTKMLKWLERPEVKERLLSNPMMNAAVKSMAFGNGNVASSESDDAIHQAYLSMTAPMLKEIQMNRHEQLLRNNNIFSAKSGMQLAEGLALYTGVADHFEGKSREKIVEYFRENIFFGTQIHEVGHTVGLRHNFSASLDPLNYHDAFWEIERMKQTGCQNAKNVGACKDGKVTVKEARTGGKALEKMVKGKSDVGYVSQAEFRLASVMDYTADSAGRFAGLGKYDQAAINFAYGGHVQKWKDNIDLPADHRLNLQRAHWSKIPANFVDTQTFHPNSACESGGNVEKRCVRKGIDTILNKREWVTVEDAKKHKMKVLQNNAKVVSGGKKNLMLDRMVEYNFCSDDREGRTLGCQTFDWGSNQVEVLGYAFEKFWTLQPFRRYRGSDINAGNGLINDYAGRLLRTLELADAPFRYFSFYKRLDYNIGAFTEDLEQAARMGLNFYGRLLTTPEPKLYCKYEDGDLPVENNLEGKVRNAKDTYIPADIYLRAQALGKCEKQDRMKIPEGPGQYFAFNWSPEYNYRINRVGTFIDKTLAAGRLFQLDANFTFSSFITDLRATNISYWTEFPDPLYKFIHGVFVGDYSQFGGGCTTMTDGKCPKSKYHTWKMLTIDDKGNGKGTKSAMPKNLKRVYDPTSFDIRMRMVVNALSEFSSWQDQKSDFNEYLLISATERERNRLPDPSDKSNDFKPEDEAVFVHPDTNRKYVAIRAPDGKSITYDLVKWANDIKAKYEQAKNTQQTDAANEYKEDLENIVAKINLIREARAVFTENSSLNQQGALGQ